MIINKKSLEVHLAPTKNAIFISVFGDIVYFTQRACELFKLKQGKYLHFDNDGAKWMFFQNEDPDGFRLTMGNKNKTLKITHRGLAMLLRRSTGHVGNVRFYMIHGLGEVNGFKMVEIITHITYEQFLKKAEET